MKRRSSLHLPWKPDADDPAAIGDKQPLPGAMRREILRHLPHLADAALDSYSFERRHTPFPEAKWDIFVFDPEGRPVILGREFFGGVIAFWPIPNTSAGRVDLDTRMHLPPRKKVL